MPRMLRPMLLVAALALAVPALAPARAHAAAATPQTDLGIPKPVMKFVKDNWKMLYIMLDELIDDLTGCDCPPKPPAPQPVPEPAPSPGMG